MTSSSSGAVHPAPAGSSRAGLYVVAAGHLVVLAAFYVLRRHQLSLPDPYNNPFTGWSTACLLVSFALWGAGLAWCVWRVRRRLRVPLSVWVWLVAATLYVSSVFVNLLRFVFP